MSKLAFLLALIFAVGSTFILSFDTWIWAAGSVFVASALVPRRRNRLSRPFWAIRRMWNQKPRKIELADTDNHGHAKLMDTLGAHAAFTARTGKLVGRADDGELLFDECFNTSGVSLEFVGTRMGKSSRAAAQIALWPTSLIVFDPAAELAHMTWRLLTMRGRRVHIMNPDTNPLDKAGQPFNWNHLIARTNVIGWIDINDPLAGMHVEALAALFFDDTGIAKTQGGEFFSGRADSLLTCLIAHVLWGGPLKVGDRPIIPALPPDLISVMEFLSLPGDDLRAALTWIGGHSPSTLARRYATQLCDAHPETFTDIHQTTAEATRWLLTDVLADMVCGDDFDIRDVRTDPDIALFVQIPQWACQKFPNIPSVVFGSILVAKMLAPGDTFPLVITDESWMLKTRAIREIIVNGGKYGMALHMFWPSMGSMDRAWGKESRAEAFDAAAWIALGPLGDIEAARQVSESCGTYGAMAYSAGDNSSTQLGTGLFGRLSRGNNLNRHPIKRHVFYSHEIMQDLDRRVRLILRLKDPLVVGSAPWFEIRELDGLIDDTPYARKRKPLTPWSWIRMRRRQLEAT